ncbi:hypothetical protein E4H04_10560 [Candidatus Bathyarchaeota archaeon]|nr:MAG: hypothetical protein E4H04_10560 [Candidatus Bathyarchaeota archaeon]
MIELSAIRDIVAIFGVIAGFSYYVLTVRATRRNQQQQLETRQAQFFMQIRDNWDMDMIGRRSEIMVWEWDDYHDFIGKYGPDSNPEAWRKLISVGSFFEGLGVMVERGFIDPYLVDDLLSGPIIQFWEKTSPFFLEMRKVMNWPQAGEWLEYLYDVVKEIRDKQHPEIKHMPTSLKWKRN